MHYPSYHLYIPHPRRFYSLIKAYRRKTCFDSSTVREILNYFNLELTGPLTPITAGMRNKSLIVNTSQGPKFLKRYKESLGETTIVQEHSILRFLQRKDFPSVRLEPTPAGQTLIHFENKRYALFEFVEGHRIFDYFFLPSTLKKLIYLAGYVLGKLHTQLHNFIPDGYNPDGFNPETGKRWRDIEWFFEQLEYIKKFFANVNGKKQNKIFKSIIADIEILGSNLLKIDKLFSQVNLPQQIIHKDFGRSNILFQKNKLPTVIDFEIARMDWKLIDLINGWEHFCRGKSGFNVDKMKIFLNAYRKEQHISDEEARYLPTIYKYINITRCIINFKIFCISGEKILLKNALHHFKRIKIDHRDCQILNQKDLIN
jgi:Ser/Thr protein kinase RdoA (MazF antagonist)